ncbi:hypothetical protein SISNIDRAFT_488780 [Sistotremastrum niveocremeum HHB9708]|uniref:NADH:ubiquinone reductase (non-electrogenic) n=1 Tax=Sistotremastrum niveocremeum HHB9708 TaxID=1314777 RepID=A0A164QS74_9AGAM|nr:hypothetical protein SISNIDRAFT_488780 [Sistotremastrum niveocremeum HHB9708]
MKELGDAEKFQGHLMACVESAAFSGQSEEEMDQLLYMVVVGGGPTGIELAREIPDFLETTSIMVPELAERIKITLIETLPSDLPIFSKQLIWTIRTQLSRCKDRHRD